jgi:hypothetical protein
VQDFNQNWNISTNYIKTPTISNLMKILKTTIFWDMTLCGSCENRRFGGRCRLHHQGERNQLAKNNISNSQHCGENLKSYRMKVLFRNVSWVQTEGSSDLNRFTNKNKKQTNSVSLSPRANYTDWYGLLILPQIVHIFPLSPLVGIESVLVKRNLC